MRAASKGHYNVEPYDYNLKLHLSSWMGERTPPNKNNNIYLYICVHMCVLLHKYCIGPYSTQVIGPNCELYHLSFTMRIYTNVYTCIHV